MSHLLQQQIAAVPLQQVVLDRLLLCGNNTSGMSTMAQTLTGLYQTVLSKAARTTQVNHLSKGMNVTPCTKPSAMWMVHMCPHAKSQSCSQTLLQAQAQTAAQSRYSARMKRSKISAMVALCVTLGH